MRRLFIVFYLAAAIAGASAEETAKVSRVLDGKPSPLAAAIAQKLAADSTSLLASCRYASAHDGNANLPNFADAEKQSHLLIVFAQPQAVEVMSEKIAVNQMVITLPLSSGMIWVSSNHGASYLPSYFAKFSYDICVKIQGLLKEAARP